MWVWVAMRCFFDVDCTSSILITATARRRNQFGSGNGEEARRGHDLQEEKAGMGFYAFFFSDQLLILLRIRKLLMHTDTLQSRF